MEGEITEKLQDQQPEPQQDQQAEKKQERQQKQKQQPKKEKQPPQPKKEKEQPKKKEEKSKKKDDADEEEEESFEEPAKKFDTIVNLEDAKRAFANGVFEEFHNLVIGKGLKFYICKYKFAADKNGSPDFVAKNLVGGMVRNFEKVRKHFFIGFRCLNLGGKTYDYPSFWIYNSTAPMKDVIGEAVDDFEFNEVPEAQIQEFFDKIEAHKKNPIENCLAEAFVL